VGLRDAIARSAAGCAHVLVVEAPGRWRTRAAVERALLTRGWRLAVSPADADVLVVCGEPGPRLGEAVELVWHQMPGPRVRVDVREHDEVVGRLDEGGALLRDTAHHRHDARHRPTASDLLGEHGDHGDMDHGDMDHGDMDHGDMDHGDMDHGDMDMAPGGIPLAGGGEDRDGLEMDVLDVRLGPVLPHWPAGLVLRCSLQGDVITAARAEVVDGADHAAPPGDRAARTIDNVVSLLALAGWDDAAAEARRVRDAVLEHGPDESARAGLDGLRRKVRRSRVLRWSLRRVGPLSEDDVHRDGLPAETVGDTYDRLIRMLDRAADASGDQAPTYSTHHLERLVTGSDLATARLVVAGLDVHGLRAGHAEHEVTHG
jgi:hypothetical protein